MKLIRYNHPLNHTLNELADWFGEPLSELEPFSRFLNHRFRDLVSGDSRLSANVFESVDHYVSRFHLPGVAKEDVQLKLEPGSELVVSYERKRASEAGTEVARASRRLKLPDDASTDEVMAKLEDGVLTVTIGKRAESQPRNIEIN